ncbi:Ctr copper transporter [Trema orientale]|uniref:Copper transport protein n=1 Tax=Trema orientale TaxID=63057 RepID=A0A2P5E5Z5_TREOI|nr:Ctr copper transporter [Trema orientale]
MKYWQGRKSESIRYDKHEPNDNILVGQTQRNTLLRLARHTNWYVCASFDIHLCVSVLVEWLTHRHNSMITIKSSSNYSRINSCNNVIIDDNYNVIIIGLVETLVHALRVGLAYMVMLGVMSYDVGVLLAVVAGRGLGFLLFGTI